MNTRALLLIVLLALISARSKAQSACNPSTDYRCATGDANSTNPGDQGPRLCTGLSTTEDAARLRLFQNGFNVNFCPCPAGTTFDEVVTGIVKCTEVGGLLADTIDRASEFRREIGITLLITGGTEPGHKGLGTEPDDCVTCPYRHDNGFKIDLQPVAEISDFVVNQKRFNRIGARSNGDPEYGIPRIGSTPDGPIFANEISKNHWDIVFPPPPDSASSIDVTVTGNGTGQVNSAPAFIVNCSSVCGYPIFTRGIKIDFTASPDLATSVFDGWNGLISSDPLPNGLTATVFADGVRTITATFDLIPPQPPVNPSCWKWDPTLNSGLGGYVWSCPAQNPPPNGGAQPPGCWLRWDPILKAWLRNICGGSSGNRSSLASVSVITATAHDPNEKLGTQGVGPSQYLQRTRALRYAVFFSNLETATAPAQEIVVTDQLDLARDEIASFSLGPIAFGDILITPPPAASTFSRIVDLRPGNNLLVRMDASLDPTTGLVTWHFRSLDPATDQPPLDPFAGFLPPGGEGSVFFTVMPKAGLTTNTQINNQATIVFDVNAPIPTQTWLNTIDNDKPQSHVLTLPAQSSATIRLQWTGTDVGTGVQDFTIFVSDNGTPFTPFLTNTAATSVSFPGQPGHTYAFFSTARDLVGNVEDPKTAAEATTTVVTDAIPPSTTATAAPLLNANGWNNSNVTIALTATDNPGGSGVQQITFSASGAQSIPTTNTAGSSASALISTEGITSFSFFATDLAANIEAPHTLTIQLDKTPPSISGTRAPLANANGWNNTDVTASFTCTDALSGLAAGSPPTPTVVSTEGMNQQVTGTCRDLADNTDSATVSGINIDKTPPTITPSRSPAPNANGWNNTNVTVSFACADALSGLAPGSPPAPTVLSSEGTNQQVSDTCFDLTGNSASAAVTGINIDKTPPALSGLPVANCTLWPPDKRFVTVATISAGDVLSGLASFSVTGTSNEAQDPNDPDIIISGTGLGPRTIQLRADRLGRGTGRIYTITSTSTDSAGNMVSAITTCTVPHDQAP